MLSGSSPLSVSLTVSRVAHTLSGTSWNTKGFAMHFLFFFFSWSSSLLLLKQTLFLLLTLLQVSLCLHFHRLAHLHLGYTPHTSGPQLLSVPMGYAYVLFGYPPHFFHPVSLPSPLTAVSLLCVPGVSAMSLNNYARLIDDQAGRHFLI